jgi:long-chain acyl-CoA synthetase
VFGKVKARTGGRMRIFVSGGAPLGRELAEFFGAVGLLVMEGYGLTETSPVIAVNLPTAMRPGTVGRPLPSLEVKIAPDGEILCRGPNVMKGYYNQPEATAEVLEPDGWFHTGDVGVLDADGYLAITDRKKDILVTSGGKNVPPANIEIHFRDDPYIAHLVVYGDGKRYLTAGVWLDDEAVKRKVGEDGGDAEAVRALVQQRIDRVNAELPSYETIKRFVVIDAPLTVADGLLTATLKVRRKKVYERFREAFEALYA